MNVKIRLFCLIFHISPKSTKKKYIFPSRSLSFYVYLFSIDATNSSKLGMYVNDSPLPNCSMKLKSLNGVPYLCLYALSDIPAKEELRYNYGAPNMWWRKKVSKLGSFLYNIFTQMKYRN